MTLNKIYATTGKLIVIGLVTWIVATIFLLVSDAFFIVQSMQDMSTYLEDN